MAQVDFLWFDIDEWWWCNGACGDDDCDYAGDGDDNDAYDDEGDGNDNGDYDDGDGGCDDGDDGGDW